MTIPNFGNASSGSSKPILEFDGRLQGCNNSCGGNYGFKKRPTDGFTATGHAFAGGDRSHGAAALGLAAQVERRISPEMLRDATALLDQDFDDERLRIVTPALQSNLDQFEIIRDLEIDDLVEPATLFLARGKP